MSPLALLVQILAFYILYNTSRRAVLRRDTFSVWLQKHPRLSKISGLILLFTSFSFFVKDLGLGVGVLTGFITLMTIGSLIILFVPIKTKNT